MKRELSFLLAAAMAASLAGCASAAADTAGNNTVAADSAAAELTSYTAADAVTLTFTDSGINGSGSGVEIDGTALTISEPGTYLLTGSCADGSVKVKKGTTDVTLILSGLNLTSSTTAPIVCGKSSQVTIVAADGTDNTLTDAAQNNDTEYPDNTDAENAVIKCKDGAQVVLCGSGNLTINANGKNGIKSGAADSETAQDASLTIRELTLTVNAPVNDAVNAEQLLNVESGAITIDAADDALHCDLVMNVGADGTDGPTVTITNAYEGLEAATLNIASGNIDITCSDDCLNAASSLLTDYDFAMNISGGTIRAYTSGGDGFDSNGTMTISGGDIEVWTANAADNQPLDADGTITLTGGTVLAAGGSSGMGMTITAEQAYVTFGSGRGGMGGGFGGGQQPTDGERPELPDNTDARTSDAPTPPQGENGTAPQGAPDGSDAAAQQPPTMQADNSADGSGISLTAGDSFTITDADGNTVYSGTAVCNASYVFYASSALTTDASYTLTDGSTSAEATAQTGTSSSGMEGGMGGMGGQRPDDNGSQNTDAVPADNGQKQPA
ncbi:carbohydrate-binding domain-containing protein [Gemmiger sp.]